ncbi:MAG: glutamine amidotransferase [Actinobacteria bacterium]|jgi:hypothetical protein|nr:glutamine amidotransferase [Actinomycetota bacterium]
MSEGCRVISVFPELLGTYGDSGNTVILAKRLELRGFKVDFVEINPGVHIPSDGDFYLIGGGEDGPQARASDLLAIESPLSRAIDRGAAIFAVCAGFQILGNSFPASNGRKLSGLGLFRVETHRHLGPRSVGELLVSPLQELHLPILSGYENHQSVTEVLANGSPLGTVLVGKGNNFGSDPKVDGAIEGKAIGTYMHGPAFARNPKLCDLVISSVVGPIPEIEDIELTRSHQLLYQDRLNAAQAVKRRT